MQIEDVRDQLPLKNWEAGRWGPKTSITVHWNGGPVPAIDPLDMIKADAAYQMRPGWSGTADGADGVLYHWFIAPDGKVFKTRDDDAVLWHCADPVGNERSYAVQVMIGSGQLASSAQLSALTELILFLGLDQVKPHRIWSQTACPGDELTAWVANRSWEGEVVTEADFVAMYDRLIKPGLDATVQAMKDRLSIDAHHSHVTGEPVEKK